VDRETFSMISSTSICRPCSKLFNGSSLKMPDREAPVEAVASDVASFGSSTEQALLWYAVTKEGAHQMGAKTYKR